VVCEERERRGGNEGMKEKEKEEGRIEEADTCIQ
jgi:hypothetical protein